MTQNAPCCEVGPAGSVAARARSPTRPRRRAAVEGAVLRRVRDRAGRHKIRVRRVRNDGAGRLTVGPCIGERGAGVSKGLAYLVPGAANGDILAGLTNVVVRSRLLVQRVAELAGCVADPALQSLAVCVAGEVKVGVADRLRKALGARTMAGHGQLIEVLGQDRRAGQCGGGECGEGKVAHDGGLLIGDRGVWVGGSGAVGDRLSNPQTCNQVPSTL